MGSGGEGGVGGGGGARWVVEGFRWGGGVYLQVSANRGIPYRTQNTLVLVPDGGKRVWSL